MRYVVTLYNVTPQTYKTFTLMEKPLMLNRTHQTCAHGPTKVHGQTQTVRAEGEQTED